MSTLSRKRTKEIHDCKENATVKRPKVLHDHQESEAVKRKQNTLTVKDTRYGSNKTFWEGNLPQVQIL